MTATERQQQRDRSGVARPSTPARSQQPLPAHQQGQQAHRRRDPERADQACPTARRAAFAWPSSCATISRTSSGVASSSSVS